MVYIKHRLYSPFASSLLLLVQSTFKRSLNIARFAPPHVIAELVPGARPRKGSSTLRFPQSHPAFLKLATCA